MFKDTNKKQTARVDQKIKKKNQNQPLRCLKEIHFKYENTDILKAKKSRKIYHANTHHKKGGMAIFTSDKDNYQE